VPTAASSRSPATWSIPCGPIGPTPQASPLLPVPLAWSGQSTSEKLALLRSDLSRSGAHALVAVKLDQIAWLLNLRSQSDVPFNPVFESFLILEPTACHLFVRDPWTRVPAALRSDLGDVQIHDYDDFARGLSRIQGPVLIDPTGVTAGVVSTLEQQGTKILRALSPIEIRKAVKNPAEQEAMRRANLRASVAKTKALLWLRREHAAGSLVTERRFREVIEAAYREQPEFFDLSFDTIAATGPHGAIIHYGGADETPLEEGHLFLIDSGAHIGGGTTDDTRTVAVGRASAEARRIFTLVLKGHINAARQIIPEGIPGTALDALARAPLWNAGLSYDHGTGHGVGAFLNVHEGPFSLSDRERKPHLGQPLREGIVSSIEPGYYRPGFGGVRLENLYLYVKADLAGATRPFLRLEPLSYIPFDPELTEESLLDPPEKAWLAQYHQQCLDKLRPHLKETERYELQALLR
jgi:Xaa-Pro aminopeptidase